MSASPLESMPNSLSAEQAVLGGLMLDNCRWDEVADRIVADDFYTSAHREIFSEMERLLSHGKPIDLITLAEALEQNGKLERAGGFAYLAEMSKNTPSAANICAYADIVRERAVVREMISVANEIAEAGYAQDGRGSNELLDMAERRVFEIAEKRQKSGSGPKDIASILDATVSRIEELFQRPHDGVTGLDTGFTDLNKKTAGLQPSDLIIVAARPSMGTAAKFIGIGRCYLRHQLLWPSSSICSSCSWASSHAISHSSRPDLALACCCRQAVNSALRL